MASLRNGAEDGAPQIAARMDRIIDMARCAGQHQEHQALVRPRPTQALVAAACGSGAGYESYIRAAAGGLPKPVAAQLDVPCSVAV